MLSAKLVQLIEDHWEGITNSILRQLRSDPKLAHIGLLPDSELRDTGRIMLKNLGAILLVLRLFCRASIFPIVVRVPAVRRTKVLPGRCRSEFLSVAFDTPHNFGPFFFIITS